MSIENINPVIYDKLKEREVLPKDEDDSVFDDIDDREIFGKIQVIQWNSSSDLGKKTFDWVGFTITRRFDPLFSDDST